MRAHKSILSLLAGLVVITGPVFLSTAPVAHTEVIERPVVARHWPLSHGFHIDDQGQTSMCIAYAWHYWLDAHGSYVSVSVLSDWEGIALRDGMGGYADNMLMSLREAGYVHEWVEIRDAETLRDYVLHNGPVVLNVPWYNSMGSMQPDGYVFVDQTSGLMSYHAVYVEGYDDNYGYHLYNSWGYAWGNVGTFWLTDEGMNTLLQAPNAFGIYAW